MIIESEAIKQCTISDGVIMQFNCEVEHAEFIKSEPSEVTLIPAFMPGHFDFTAKVKAWKGFNFQEYKNKILNAELIVEFKNESCILMMDCIACESQPNGDHEIIRFMSSGEINMVTNNET